MSAHRAQGEIIKSSMNSGARLDDQSSFRARRRVLKPQCEFQLPSASFPASCTAKHYFCCCKYCLLAEQTPLGTPLSHVIMKRYEEIALDALIRCCHGSVLFCSGQQQCNAACMCAAPAICVGLSAIVRRDSLDAELES